MKKDKKYDEEFNPLEDCIERLSLCRVDYHKLYQKNFKVASIRLRQDLEYIIQTAKQMKKDALAHRKKIEENKQLERDYQEKLKNEGIE
jgi:hypothetical protein